jgi:hypothetical protein
MDDDPARARRAVQPVGDQRRLGRVPDPLPPGRGDDLREGVPAGPYVGRDAIAEGYHTNPPTDTIRIRSVAGDRVDFAWSSGGTGSMTLHRRDELITELAVVFD